MLRQSSIDNKNDAYKMIHHIDMIDFNDRLNTFLDFNKKWPARNLVEEGFFFQFPDLVCYRCNCKVKEGENPWKIHKQWCLDKNYKDCTFQMPKHRRPTLKKTFLRLKTFNTWPVTFQCAAEFANCGFRYTGWSDIVICYSCNTALNNWLPEDDPWEEHARFEPFCFHLSIKWFYYSDAERLKTLRNPTAEILQKAMIHLNDKFMCNVCKSLEKSYLFLPCNHLVCCKICVNNVCKCPVCRKSIESKIKIFIP